MARRKGWYELSDAYRDRLTRNGIGRNAYERGDSLSGARGHRATPERGMSSAIRNPGRYQEYITRRSAGSEGIGESSRDSLMHEALAIADAYFDGNSKYEHDKMENAMRNPNVWTTDRLIAAARLSQEQWETLARRARNARYGGGPKSDLVYEYLYYH
jgi:hypothetical protein